MWYKNKIKGRENQPTRDPLPLPPKNTSTYRKLHFASLPHSTHIHIHIHVQIHILYVFCTRSYWGISCGRIFVSIYFIILIFLIYSTSKPLIWLPTALRLEGQGEFYLTFFLDVHMKINALTWLDYPSSKMFTVIKIKLNIFQFTSKYYFCVTHTDQLKTSIMAN